MDPMLIFAGLRLSLAFALVALACALLAIGLRGTSSGLDRARRPGLVALSLLAVLPMAQAVAALRPGPWLEVPLAAAALALVLGTLKTWRQDHAGRVWRALRTAPEALRRMGVEARGPRMLALLLTGGALPLAAALMAELASVDVVLPLAALLLATLDRRLRVVLPLAAFTGFLSLPLAGLSNGGLWVLLPFAIVALVVLGTRPAASGAVGLG